MNNDLLAEQLKTVRNLCDISLFLIKHGENNLLCTVLEILLVEVQQVVDEQCVVKPFEGGE